MRTVFVVLIVAGLLAFTAPAGAQNRAYGTDPSGNLLYDPYPNPRTETEERWNNAFRNEAARERADEMNRLRMEQDYQQEEIERLQREHRQRRDY